MTDELKQWEYDRGYEKGKTEVLDKIIAEIEQEYNRLGATRADETLELGECLGLKMSLKIIDKYRKDQECGAKYSKLLKQKYIPFLMHKELNIPISDCQKAYDVAIDYLRNQASVSG